MSINTSLALLLLLLMIFLCWMMNLSFSKFWQLRLWRNATILYLRREAWCHLDKSLKNLEMIGDDTRWFCREEFCHNIVHRLGGLAPPTQCLQSDCVQHIDWWLSQQIFTLSTDLNPVIFNKINQWMLLIMEYHVTDGACATVDPN